MDSPEEIDGAESKPFRVPDVEVIGVDRELGFLVWRTIADEPMVMVSALKTYAANAGCEPGDLHRGVVIHWEPDDGNGVSTLHQPEEPLDDDGAGLVRAEMSANGIPLKPAET